MANPWTTLDAPILSLADDGEMVARAVAVQIAANLPTQCSAQDQLWAQRDQDFATAMNIPYRRTIVQFPPSKRIYLGARPSLVESPGELWPAVTVRADKRVPSSDAEQADQYDSWDVTFIIEALACAGPFPDVVQDRDPSDEIDRQFQRLAGAVHACIMYDRTLGGTTFPIKRPPQMLPSLPRARKSDKGAGQNLLFQGMQLTYVATRLSF